MPSSVDLGVSSLEEMLEDDSESISRSFPTCLTSASIRNQPKFGNGKFYFAPAGTARKWSCIPCPWPNSLEDA